MDKIESTLIIIGTTLVAGTLLCVITDCFARNQSRAFIRKAKSEMEEASFFTFAQNSP
jgi:hypothetical protein